MNIEKQHDYYNLPLASFTFGKGGQTLPSQTQDNSQNQIQNVTFANGQVNNDQNNYNYSPIIKETINQNSLNGECELTFGKNTNQNSIKIEENSNNSTLRNSSNPKQIYHSIFIDNEMCNNSFIRVILYTIYHMKLLRKYLINDPLIKNNKNILFYLREIISQIGKKKTINISQFREILSNNYQNHRKFLIDQPDDPLEFFFAIINSIHSLSIQNNLNEIFDENCSIQCFSHKFLWLDLARIDECECGGNSKRLFSNHNYITDIPINKIFNLMNYSVNKALIYEDYQKLFVYYNNLLDNIKMNCPTNGTRCNINKTHHKLHLSNSPNYLIFNLEHDYLNEKYSLMNILKSFVLIPVKFDIWSLFELNSKKNKVYFDLIGIILYKINKIYSCVFKNKNDNYIYYEEEININFNTYYDFVFYAIKNGLIPVGLFYQGSYLSNNKNNFNNNLICNNIKDILNNEQVKFLEKFCLNNDNLFKIMKNKIRTDENLFSMNQIYLSNSSKIVINKEKNNNGSPNIILKKDNKNNLIHSNRKVINEYYCINCNQKNSIDNKTCIRCGFKYIEKNNFNKNSLSSDIGRPSDINNLSENNSKNVQNYLDLPMPYKPNIKDKEKPIMLIPSNNESKNLGNLKKIIFDKSKNPLNNSNNEKNSYINAEQPYFLNRPLTSKNKNISRSVFISSDNNDRDIRYKKNDIININNSYLVSDDRKRKYQNKNISYQFNTDFSNNNSNYQNRNNNNLNQKNLNINSINNENNNYFNKKSNKVKNNNVTNLPNNDKKKFKKINPMTNNYIDINIKIGHWKCENCSNINRDDYNYCKICKRDREGMQKMKFSNNFNNTQRTKSMKVNNSNNNINRNSAHNNRYNNNSIKKGLDKHNKRNNTLSGFNKNKQVNMNKNLEEYNYINNNNFTGRRERNEIKREYNNTRSCINKKYNI